jgi:hypothetical protein
VTLDIHAVVQHAAKLDTVIVATSIQQAMTRTLDSPDSGGHAIAAMGNVVSPQTASDLGTVVTSRPIGLFGDIDDRANEQRLIPQSRLPPKHLVRPGKN